MIAERESDLQTRYIFIKKFEFLVPEVSEALSGHPHVGKVYQSSYNTYTKHHKLILPDRVMLAFSELVGTSEAAEFELVEVNIDNILDFDIREEDLDVFLKNDGPPTLQQAMIQFEDEEVEFAHRASHSMMNLWSLNSVKAEILLDIANCLTELELTSHEDAANDLRYSEHGAGINIAEALRALSRYVSDNKKINGDTADLIVAVESIVTELERNYDLE